MNILEFQAKEICSEYGIPIPKSVLLSNTRTILQLDQYLNFPIILKSQVHSKERGQQGGICLARNSKEAADLASRMFATQIHGTYPDKLLAEEMIQFGIGYAMQIYYDEENLDITIKVSPTLSPSETDETEIKASAPSCFKIDPFEGLLDSVIFDIAASLEIDRMYWRAFTVVSRKIWEVFRDLDVINLSINPLVISSNGLLFILGIDMEFDDKALFRQSKLKTLTDISLVDEMGSVLPRLGCDYQSGQGKVSVISESMEMCYAIRDLLSEKQIGTSDLIAFNNYISKEIIQLLCERIEMHGKSDLIIIDYLGSPVEVDAIIAGVGSYVTESEKVLPIVLRVNSASIKKYCKDFDEKPVSFVDSLKNTDPLIREK